MNMDERKMHILRAIIDDYILTGVPVGSRTISKKYETGLSSATIRNEMSDLEELGYLDQPHVSAGRIPSAKAYRLYVDSLLQAGKLRNDSPQAIQQHFSGRIRQMEDVIDHAARVISSLTNYTAVVLSPKGQQPRLQTVQLVPVGNGTALVVVVTDMGIVRDSMIRIGNDMDDAAAPCRRPAKSCRRSSGGCRATKPCFRACTDSCQSEAGHRPAGMWPLAVPAICWPIPNTATSTRPGVS